MAAIGDDMHRGRGAVAVGADSGRWVKDEQRVGESAGSFLQAKGDCRGQMRQLLSLADISSMAKKDSALTGREGKREG